MPPAYDFKLALTRAIEPTGEPGAELATLEDAARFLGLMKPWRQARPHWDFATELLLRAVQTREDRTAALMRLSIASTVGASTKRWAPCLTAIFALNSAWRL